MHEEFSQPGEGTQEEQDLTPEEEADLASLNAFLDKARAEGRLGNASDPEIAAAREKLRMYGERLIHPADRDEHEKMFNPNSDPR